MMVLSRPFGALYLSSLLLQLGATLFISYLALRLDANGVAEFWIGALMGAHSLGMVIGAPVGNLLIQRIGHVRTYAASAGMVVVAVIGHAVTTELPYWLLLRAIVGVAMMCQLMVIESWLNERAPARQRGRVLAMYMVATYIGMIFGQLGLSVAGDQRGAALFGIAMAFAIGLAPLAATRGQRPTMSASVEFDVWSLLRSLPRPMLTVLVSGALNGSFFGLAAIYAKQQGLDTAEIGRFLAVVIGAGLLAQYPLGLLSDRLPRIVITHRIAMLLAITFIPLALFQHLSSNAVLVAGFCIGALQFNLYPLGAAMANEQTEPAQRIPVSGLLLTVFGIGSGIGPLVAGALMQSYGSGCLYLFSAGCAALLALATRSKSLSRQLS